MKKTAHFLITAVGAVILSSLGYLFAIGSYSVWFSAWIAPIPVLLFSYYRNWFVTAVVAFLVGFLGWSCYFEYIKTLLPITHIFWFLVAHGVAFMIIILLNRFLVRYLKNFLTIFSFPCLMVLYEFVMMNFSPAGNLGSIAYTQVGNFPIMQLASITGILGITFIASLLPAAVSISWYLRRNQTESVLSLLFMLILVIAVIVFGIYRIHLHPVTKKIPVGLVSIPTTKYQTEDTNTANITSIANAYQVAVAHLAKKGAEIVLLPGQTLTIKANNQYMAKHLFAKAAEHNQVMLLVGVKIISVEQDQQVVWVFNKQGQLVATYQNYNPMHHGFSSWFQQKSLATTVTVLTRKGALGIIGCNDMGFTYPAKTYGASDVGLVFDSAVDFKFDASLQAKSAILRGVEDGFTVVRSAKNGDLTVSDSQGQLLGMRPPCRDKVSSLLINAPIGKGGSYYSKTGNWFVWFCLGLFIFLLLLWEYARLRRLS